MRRHVLIGLSLFALVACSDADALHSGTGAWAGDGDRAGEGEWAGDSAGAPSMSGTGGEGASPGTLTAGAWDDNRNFERFVEYVDGSADSLPIAMTELEAAHARFGGEREAHTRLDIALVIDTTGSMGDEISYLQAELDAIATSVASAHPDAETRWALVVYRDESDDYVTRTFDFGDVDALRTALRAERAAGGGDYPEASHAALADLTNLAWRDGADVARIAFWVADAPHHAQRATDLSEALRTASQLDVHIYPVASSGVDALTELSMRIGAQLTGGRYLFLTDDSGVGGSHLEPSIPCYFVTLLNHAMLRMIDIEMTGIYREPTAAQIIRTGGDPTDGACTLEGGDTAYIF